MPEETPANEQQLVPISRLNNSIAARKELERQIADLKKQLAEAPSVDSLNELTAALDAERKARAEDSARFEAREAFVRIGMDPNEDADAMEVIRSRYEKLPKKDRPALYDWLSGDAKEDRLASRLLPAPEAPKSEAPAEDAKPAEAAPAPRPTGTNAGTAPVPPAGQTMTRGEYERAISAAKSGEEVRAVMGQYFGD